MAVQSGRGEIYAHSQYLRQFRIRQRPRLKNSFYRQAEQQTKHRIANCSLNESYPDETWKGKARNSIHQCDVVVVLIGEDTHDSSGVIVENGHGPQPGEACHPDQAPRQAI